MADNGQPVITWFDHRGRQCRAAPSAVGFQPLWPLRSVEQPFELLPELSTRAVNEPGEHRMTLDYLGGYLRDDTGANRV